MGHFYANIQGNRGEATRMGTKESGIGGHIRGWHVGGSVSCNYNSNKDRDECCIRATRGSSGYGGTHLATVIELNNGNIQIRVNPNLDKYLHEYDWVDMKEKISADIFDHDPEANDLVEYNRPHEEDCNSIAERIMELLGYKLIESEEENDDD